MQSYRNYIFKASKVLCIAKTNYYNLYCACSTANIKQLPHYSAVDQSYILNKLNENSSGDLSRFSITKTRIKKLEQWLTKKGKFDNLEELLEVDGFGIKVLEKFYKSILDERDNKEPTKKIVKDRKKNLGFLTPILTELMCQKISSVVSIHLSLNAVSWCLFDKTNSNITVKNCSVHDFTLENKRMNFTQIIQLALNIAQQIPSGDIYIFEALQNSMPSAANTSKNYVMSAERIQLLSMLSVLLASRNKTSKSKENENSNIVTKNGALSYENFDEKLNFGVHFIRNMLPARLFKTLVGNERISTEPIILQLFENSDKLLPNSVNKEPLILRPVMDFYNSLNPVHKEIFGHAILLGMAFVKVCVLQDKASIQKLCSR